MISRDFTLCLLSQEVLENVLQQKTDRNSEKKAKESRKQEIQHRREGKESQSVGKGEDFGGSLCRPREQVLQTVAGTDVFKGKKIIQWIT